MVGSLGAVGKAVSPEVTSTSKKAFRGEECLLTTSCIAGARAARRKSGVFCASPEQPGEALKLTSAHRPGELCVTNCAEIQWVKLPHQRWATLTAHLLSTVTSEVAGTGGLPRLHTDFHLRLHRGLGSIRLLCLRSQLFSSASELARSNYAPRAERSVSSRLDQYSQMVGWCLVHHGKRCVYAKRMFS